MTQAWDFVDARILWGEDSRPEHIRLDDVQDTYLSLRAINCLQHEGITTLAELVQKSEAELLRNWNFGRKSMAEVKQMLAAFGLKLSGD